MLLEKVFERERIIYVLQRLEGRSNGGDTRDREGGGTEEAAAVDAISGGWVYLHSCSA